MVARLISVAEGGDRSTPLPVPPSGRRSHVAGVTGPPGSGKSTLVDCLVTQLRATGATVAVLAVDPSSPVSGGAVYLFAQHVVDQLEIGEDDVYMVCLPLFHANAQLMQVYAGLIAGPRSPCS